MSRALVLIKPGFAFKKCLIGKIIDIFERNDLEVVALKMLKVKKNQAEQLYEEHKDKIFFNEIIETICSFPIVAFCLESNKQEASFLVRKIIGLTNPTDAEPGTIRRMYGEDKGNNCIHGSDSEKVAEKEIKIFFNENELF